MTTETQWTERDREADRRAAMRGELVELGARRMPIPDEFDDAVRRLHRAQDLAGPALSWAMRLLADEYYMPPRPTPPETPAEDTKDSHAKTGAVR